MRRQRWWSVWCLAAGLLAASACSEASPPVERGFSSRQLFAIRDTSLNLFGWHNEAWTFTTRSDTSDSGTAYWSIDLETGAVVDLGPALPATTYPTPPPGRYSCQTSSDGPPWSAFITDSQTGVTTTIMGVAGGWTCPTDADPTIQLWLEDGGGRIALWQGPYDQLARAPVELIVREIKAYEHQNNILLAGWRVLGSPLSAPDSVGLFRIDATTFAATPLLSPTLDSAAWADGSTPEGSLGSNTLSDQFFLTLTRGPYVYSRRMSDGGATLFVGPFPSEPVEVALLRLAPSAQLDDLRTDYEPTLLYSDPAKGAGTFLSFNTGLRRLTQCPSPFDIRPAATQDATGAFTAAWATSRPLLLMGPGTCQTIAPGDVVAFGFSPDQTAMAWLERPRDSDGTFWTAAIDGSGPRSLGGGIITDVPNAPRFFGAGGDLQFQLGSDLVWMDVHDNPTRLHYVAEHLYGRAIDLGKRLVAIYEHSEQDGTGRLALIERATGAKQLISPDVASFESVSTSRSHEPFPLAPLYRETSGTDVYQFVYLVRGHNPSPQDGIWIATIPAAELQ